MYLSFALLQGAIAHCYALEDKTMSPQAPDLESIYKHHLSHSHGAALQAIFEAGASHERKQHQTQAAQTLVDQQGGASVPNVKRANQDPRLQQAQARGVPAANSPPPRPSAPKASNDARRGDVKPKPDAVNASAQTSAAHQTPAQPAFNPSEDPATVGGVISDKPA